MRPGKGHHPLAHRLPAQSLLELDLLRVRDGCWQISVPAEIRKKLGIGPGSVLEWEQDGDRIIVRRAGAVNSEDIHKSLFGSKTPKPKTWSDPKSGIRDYVRKRYASR